MTDDVVTVELLRITARHFCAGVELFKGREIRSAPILRYMRGWKRQRIFDYCQKKGWQCKRI